MKTKITNRQANDILFLLMLYLLVLLFCLTGCTKFDNSELKSAKVWFINSGNQAVTFETQGGSSKVVLLPFDSIDYPSSSNQVAFDMHWRAYVIDTIQGVPIDKPDPRNLYQGDCTGCSFNSTPNCSISQELTGVDCVTEKIHFVARDTTG